MLGTVFLWWEELGGQRAQFSACGFSFTFPLEGQASAQPTRQSQMPLGFCKSSLIGWEPLVLSVSTQQGDEPDMSHSQAGF